MCNKKILCLKLLNMAKIKHTYLIKKKKIEVQNLQI